MYTIGIDIGASKIAAALVRNGRILRFRKTEFKARGGHAIKQTVLRALDSVCGNARISSIGIGVPCIFTAAGRPSFCPNIRGLNPLELSRAIAKQYRVRVFMENDAKAAAMAELKYGAGRKSKNFVFVALGTGIGGAIIADGKIYKGGLGWAGEFGHTIIKIQNSKSSAKSGSASGGKIQEYSEWERVSTKRFLRSKKTPKDVNEFAKTIALGFVNITYALAPEYIVIGGGFLSLWDSQFNRKVLSAMRRMSILPGPSFPKIIRSKFGERAGVVGASLLMYDRRSTKK